MSVDTGTINELGSGVATFTLYTSGDVIHTTGIVVEIAYSGLAINGSDYIT